MYSYTKPISINKPNKIKYSFNDNPINQSFIFELIIKLNNNNSLNNNSLNNNSLNNNSLNNNSLNNNSLNNNMHIIRKIGKTKHCDILLENNNINYSDIEYFELKVIDLNNEKEYNLVDIFNNISNSFSKNDNNLYIEFSHNSVGLARATCYIMTIDINSFIISPPN
jgi:hypothetical protein